MQQLSLLQVLNQLHDTSYQILGIGESAEWKHAYQTEFNNISQVQPVVRRVFHQVAIFLNDG